MSNKNTAEANEGLHLSVINALRILKHFTEEEPEQTVKNLSESLALNKSVTSRLLATLAKEGFIHKIPGTHRFRLGTSVLSLSGVLLSTLEIYTEARPVLEHLVKVTGETAHLAVLENYHTVYLCKVNCEHVVQTMSHTGKNNPLHCTSSGKVLVANANQTVLEELIKRGLKQYTAKTITEPNVFREQLKQIKINGYALDIEEHAPGVASISAPVRDYTRKVVAAVNIVGPIQRIHEQTIPVLTNHVQKAASIISERMGYIPRLGRS